MSSPAVEAQCAAQRAGADVVWSACSALVGRTGAQLLPLHSAAPAPCTALSDPRSLMSQVPTAVAMPVSAAAAAAAAPAAPAAAAAPAAVVAPQNGAGSGLYGYSSEQLQAWRPKFNEKLKVHLNKSRTLILRGLPNLPRAKREEEASRRLATSHHAWHECAWASRPYRPAGTDFQ